MRKKSDLRGYQQRCVTHFYENDAVQAIVGMGGGKTVAALTAARELIDDGVIRCMLLLAPKRVAQLVWPREPGQWEHLADTKVKLIAGSPAARERALLAGDAEVYLVGIDNTQWLVDVLKKVPHEHPLFDLLCIDELSRFKNPRGKRAKALRTIIKRFKTRWGLTGTPRPNGFEDQYAPMKLISADKAWPDDRNFDRWRVRRFMPEDHNGYTWSLRPEWTHEVLTEIQKYSFTVADADMPDLPPMQPLFHWVELPPDAREAYDDMKRQLVAELQVGDVVAINAAVASGKLAQAAQGFMYDTVADMRLVCQLHTEKTDELAEIMEQIGDEACLITYEFQEDLATLREMIPGLAWLGHGTSDKQAAAHEAGWNDGRLKQLALHPASAGHGLNLQLGGRRMIIYGMPWSSELYDQMIKRFWRPGQERHCFVHHILARDTVDEVKYDRVIGKMSAQDAFRKHIKEI